MNRKKLFTALFTIGVLLVLTPLVLRVMATPDPGSDPALPDFYPVQDPATGKWGYIDTKGELVVPMVFDWAGDFRHGRGLVEHDRKMGYIDESFKAHGDWAIAPRFICIDPSDMPAVGFSEGLARARDPQTGQWGYLNTDGSWAIEPTFPESIYFPGLAPVGQFCDGLATIQRFEIRPRNVLDKAGNVQYDENNKPIKEDWPVENWGYIDTKGEVVIDARFDGAQDFSEGVAGVRTRSHGAWGFIDRSGRSVISPQFQGVGRFVDGLCPVKLDEIWGVIDRSGSLIIEPRFVEISDFSEGLAAAREDGQWGYIDRDGDWVIFPRFDDGEGYNSPREPGPFENGIARVYVNGQAQYINSKGETVWPK